MAMKQECIEKVSEVIGRKITAQESNDILDRFKGAVNTLMRTDPDWMSMTADQKRVKASKMVADNILKQAKFKQQQRQLQVIAQDKNIRKMNDLATNKDIHAYKAIGSILLDVDRVAKGITNEAMTRLTDTISGIRSKAMGMLENPEDVYAIAREILGEDSGSEVAKKAAKALKDVTDSLLKRLQRAGADIGQLEGWLPQSHDAVKLAHANKVLGLNGVDPKIAWMNHIRPLVDRTRYNDVHGNPITDQEFDALLSSAYTDIITKGSPDPDILTIAQKLPQHYASLKKFPSRVLHFKDAKSMLEYESKFGGASFSQSIISHIRTMGQNIAVFEELGTKPKATFELMKSIAEQEKNNAGANAFSFNPKKQLEYMKYQNNLGFTNTGVDSVWNVLTGEANSYDNLTFGKIMQGWRNLEIVGKLGKAMITSISDFGTYFANGYFHKLPFFESVNLLKTMYGKDWREYATLNGIIADSISNDFCRWGSDNLGSGWTGKLANLTLSVTWLNKFTDSIRRADGFRVMYVMGKHLGTDWDKLDQYSRSRLENGLITKKDWQIYQMAGTSNHNGLEFLTLENIRKVEQRDLLPPDITSRDFENAKTHLISYIATEGEMASLAPDLITRAESTRGKKRGTLGGEMWRSVFLFKSFPASFLRKHYERMLQLHFEDRLKYVAFIFSGTTICGAISLQIQNLLNGKDTQDINSKEFWIHAVSKGGGLGFFGDMIYNGLNGENSYKQKISFIDQIFGTVFGTASDVVDLGLSVANNAIYDKDIKVGAKAVKLARSHMPFMNLWYTSLAIDRYIMDDVNEMLSPGYNARMIKRSMKGTGQDYWWRPLEDEPRRAPQMATQPQ